MHLYQKLVLFMLAAAVGPVAVVGFALLGNAERELRSRIAAQQLAVATTAAELAARDVEEAVESLTRVAGSVRWERLSPEEREGALRLVVAQSRHFAAAVLVDAAGRDVASPVQPGSLDLAPLEAALPVAELKESAPGTVALSGIFVREQACAAALGVSVAGADGRWIVAVEVSLRSIQDRAAESSRGGVGELWLFDAASRAVASPGRGQLGSAAPAGLPPVAEPRSFGFAVGEEPVLASMARLPGSVGWWVLVLVSERAALAPVRHMRVTVLASIGGALALLLGLGFAFTRSLGGRIERLAEGARAYGRGELGQRLSESGRDELSDLGRTFNAMGTELQVSRQKLETWNVDLQVKVDERTAELKRAQAQLLEAQKLAAIGQLGAGVAHEINNPLAAILGNAQLLLLDGAETGRDLAVLHKIEAQAKRAKEITANLLRFSQQRLEADLRPLDLNRLVRETLTLVEEQLRTDGVELGLTLAEGLPLVRGDAGHLAQVLMNLVSNARTAMLKSATRRLTISTSAERGKALLQVCDTGKGIAPTDLPRIFEPFFTTKDIWSNVGLGLSVSFRIVEEHGGRIAVATEPGKGSTFTVSLPIAA